MKGISLLWISVICVGCHKADDTREISTQTDPNHEEKPNEQQAVSSTFPSVEDEGTQGVDNHLTIEMRPVSAQLCEGECIDIAVEATGGIAPYTFSWDHELSPSSGPHRVCPEVTTVYTVTVRDSGLTTEEFEIPVDTVRATIELVVKDECAASGEHGESDERAESDSRLCSDGGCEQIDPCANNNGGCDPLVDCTSTNGKPICGPCPSQYSGNGNTGCIPFWIQRIETPDHDFVVGIATDNQSSVYVTGYTDGDLDGKINTGRSDAFLVKFNAEGDKQWTQLLGTPSDDYGYGVATDSSGNVFVTGDTFGNLDGNINAGGTDSFLVKYNGEGDRLWTRQLATSEYEQGSGVAIDEDGDVYVSVETQGQLDESSGVANDGIFKIFLVKYNGEGDRLWTRQLETSGDARGAGLATDGSGNIYLTSTLSGNLGDNINAGRTDIAIAKYTDEGVLLWTRLFGQSAGERSWGVATDSSGNVYVTGITDANTDDEATNRDPLLLKYNGEGDMQWARQITASDLSYPNGIAIDGAGDVYLAATDKTPEEGSGVGDHDVYIIKYDSEGVEQWIHQRHTPESDEGFRIAIDSSDNIYVAGQVFVSFDEVNNRPLCDVFIVNCDSDGNSF